MKKNLLIGFGALLLLLNAGIPFCPDPNAKLLVQGVSALLGAGVLGLALAGVATSPERTSKVAPVVPTPIAAPPPPPRAEAEIVAFLALLQEHARLVDFASEDIAGANDAQIAAAARVVHAGTKKVLNEYFDVHPLHPGNEGDAVCLERGFDSAAYRLLGAVPSEPPFRGRLLHAGWETKAVKLPRLTNTSSSRKWPVLAPAEIEF